VLIAFRRALLALLCCGAAYAAYAALLVPWLEPGRADKGGPRLGAKAVAAGNAETAARAGVGGVGSASVAATPFEALIARHFPPEAWQVQRPKVAEYDGYVFLFRDYRQLPDGAVELKPCTLVILPKGFDESASAAVSGSSSGSGAVAPPASLTAAPPKSSSADGTQIGDMGGGSSGLGDPPGWTDPSAPLPPQGSSPPRDAPVIVAAEGGALLQFDGNTAAARGRFGRFLGGRLPGEVRVTRPESFPGAGDAMSLTTRNIQIDAQRIWTPHDVQFRYGASYGSGRDLVVTLAPPADPSAISAGDSEGDANAAVGDSVLGASSAAGGPSPPLGLPASAGVRGGAADGRGGDGGATLASPPSAASGKPTPLSGAALQGVKFIELVHL